MQGFSTSTTIRATPKRIWDILTDAAGYGRWNPEIALIDGRIELGRKIKTHVNLGKGVVRSVGVRVTALRAAPEWRMEWTGGLPLGLFTGRRVFTLRPLDGGAVDFFLQLLFSGPMAGPIVRSLGDRQPDIDALAAGLKKAAEKEPEHWIETCTPAKIRDSTSAGKGEVPWESRSSRSRERRVPKAAD
jgi:hypothetical protein